MNIKLIQEPKANYNGIQTVLSNRGIPEKEIWHWLNTTDADINDYRLLGEKTLKQAVNLLNTAITEKQNILVVVDADVDGFCSSAILINYLYEYSPNYVKEHVSWFIHDGKQHGLNDIDVDWAAEQGFTQIWSPDGGSSDYEAHVAFAQRGIDVIVLDHHDTPRPSEHAIVINNQIAEDYPNKSFCGAGITWQFCRCFDDLTGIQYANNYLDLVSFANISDMMDLRAIETKHLIFKGLQQENIHNPFLAAMIDKQSFSLGKRSIPNGIAWYITPFVNAVNRSGAMEEKELLFQSFLSFHANDVVLSDKRGHKQGETETLVTQVLRVVDRVKRRQTVAQDKALELLETKIQEEKLLEQHKMLLFLLKEGQVDKNIAGLAANQIMGKYQRPCAVLTLGKDGYAGSARGCNAKGVTQLREMCEESRLVEYAQGHSGAFGLALAAENIEPFLNSIDNQLKDMPNEQLYYVDYLYHGLHQVDAQQLEDISSLSDLYGQNVEESQIAIERLQISADMVQIYRKTNNTIKITLPNTISLMLFDASNELCELLKTTKGYVEMTVVGKVNRNEFNGNVTTQLIIDDYEITGTSKYCF